MPLSNKQMEYLALAWQCFESEPKIDYEKFKDVAGLKSVASARELMRVTKNKLKTEYGALSGSMKETNALTASTPTKSGTSSPVKSGNGAAPGSRRKRATPAKGKGGKKEKVEEDSASADEVNGVGGGDEVDESPTKKVKTYDFEMANGATIKAEPSDEDGEEEMFR